MLKILEKYRVGKRLVFFCERNDNLTISDKLYSNVGIFDLSEFEIDDSPACFSEQKSFKIIITTDINVDDVKELHFINS